VTATSKGGAMRRIDGGSMTWKSSRRALREAIALLGILLLSGQGCKGGAADGNSVTPCASVSFTGSLSSPAPGDVSLQSGAVSCDTVDIGVLVTTLSGIFTVGFEITYPSSIVAYQSFKPGPLLFQGSPSIAPAFFVTPSPGVIVVSGTLFRPDPNVTAINGATFITLHFIKVASGSGAVDFNTSPGATINNQIIDADGNVVAASFGPGHGGVVQVP
jgi:hypothetical protein